MGLEQSKKEDLGNSNGGKNTNLLNNTEYAVLNLESNIFALVASNGWIVVFFFLVHELGFHECIKQSLM